MTRGIYTRTSITAGRLAAAGWAALLVGALACGQGAAGRATSGVGSGGTQPLATAPVVEMTSTPTPTATPQPTPTPGIEVAPITNGTWRLQIPEIGVNHPITEVGLEASGALGAPTGPDEVGWYKWGPPPGAPGNVLMDGHVDWTDRATGRPRGGVFFYLRQLEPGNRITFSDGQKQVVYEVVEKRRYRWDDPNGVEVLQPTEDNRLTVITCGGTFDRGSHSYDQRDVVIAKMVL